MCWFYFIKTYKPWSFLRDGLQSRSATAVTVTCTGCIHAQNHVEFAAPPCTTKNPPVFFFSSISWVQSFWLLEHTAETSPLLQSLMELPTSLFSLKGRTDSRNLEEQINSSSNKTNQPNKQRIHLFPCPLLYSLLTPSSEKCWYVV